jgi:hypothetical protein
MIHQQIVHNVIHIVFNNEFYLSALQTIRLEISNLFPFWQLELSELRYELKIIAVHYLKDSPNYPLHPHHEMEFPTTPQMIQQALKSAQTLK